MNDADAPTRERSPWHVVRSVAWRAERDSPSRCHRRVTGQKPAEHQSESCGAGGGGGTPITTCRGGLAWSSSCCRGPGIPGIGRGASRDQDIPSSGRSQQTLRGSTGDRRSGIGTPSSEGLSPRARAPSSAGPQRPSIRLGSRSLRSHRTTGPARAFPHGDQSSRMGRAETPAGRASGGPAETCVRQAALPGSPRWSRFARSVRARSALCPRRQATG